MSYYRNNTRYADEHTSNQQYHSYQNQAIHHEYYNNDYDDYNQHYYINNNHGQHCFKQRNEYRQKQQQQHEVKQERSWIEYDEEDNNNNNNDINDNYSDHSSSENEHEYEHKYEYNLDRESVHTFNYYSRERTQNIRDMNNWCKYVNITHSIRDIYSKNNERKINILDLGCGAGNDLFKCRGNKKYINKYLAMDLDKEYITTARKKYFKILQDGIKHRNASYEERKKFSLNNAYGQTAKEFYDESIFDAQFVIQDMTSKTLYLHPLIQSIGSFDLISIQFALHFAFQTNKSILALLKTIETATKKGSFFLCSFVRDDVIINRLSKLMNDGATYNDQYVTFDNEFQSITMKKTDFKSIQNVYNNEYDAILNDDDNDNHGLIGIKYKYFQMDSVEGMDGNGDYEWFISFPVLCKLLFKYCKMRLVYKKTASDIYIESSRKFPYRYGYSKGRELNNVKWTKDEQQVIDTYAYALFERV